MRYIINIEVKLPEETILKHILVWNYFYGEAIEAIYHYISYKNTEKRGIGQWNIKYKQL